MLLELSGVAKGHGGRSLFRNVDLVVRAGDRLGLVGPNGAGKTTLLRIAAGLDQPDEGERRTAKGARIALLRQEIDPGQEHSVRAETATALAALDALEAELRTLEARMTEHGQAGDEVPPAVAERYDVARRQFENAGGFEREARIERVLAGLGFSEEKRDQPLSALSGGWMMRVELAKLLLSDPDVLLLDEPTNHLDLPSIEWFEETLAAFRGGVVVISHDRTFLRRHATRVAELAAGRFDVTEGSFDHYLEARAERRALAMAQRRTQDRQIAETERFIERFRSKASKARQVQSRVKALDKIERVEVPDEIRQAPRLRIPPAPRAGAVVLRLSDAHKAYGETRVYEGIDLEVGRGERVALAGPNGAGKSTLLRMLAGTLEPDAGVREIGHNVQVAFYAQHQLEDLDPADTVLGALERVAMLDDHARLRSHLGAFLFSGDDVKKKVSVLSGGEKARVALAKLLLRPANVLVLDEPTNHLDVDACEVLEEALRGYDGTLVFISHDRSFINALATRVIDVRSGRLREYPGDFDDYHHQLAEGDAPTPKPATAAPGPAPAKAPRAPSSGEDRRRERERRKTRDRTQRRLEKLEAEILEKETALEALGWQLGDPAVHRDGEQSRALTGERDALTETIAALYRDWESLAAELEALADAPS